jgi:hypothetical protein
MTGRQHDTSPCRRMKDTVDASPVDAVVRPPDAAETRSVQLCMSTPYVSRRGYIVPEHGARFWVAEMQAKHPTWKFWYEDVEAV